MVRFACGMSCNSTVYTDHDVIWYGRVLVHHGPHLSCHMSLWSINGVVAWAPESSKFGQNRHWHNGDSIYTDVTEICSTTGSFLYTRLLYCLHHCASIPSLHFLSSYLSIPLQFPFFSFPVSCLLPYLFLSSHCLPFHFLPFKLSVFPSLPFCFLPLVLPYLLFPCPFFSSLIYQYSHSSVFHSPILSTLLFSSF